jgi:hypothetical protein
MSRKRECPPGWALISAVLEWRAEPSFGAWQISRKHALQRGSPVRRHTPVGSRQRRKPQVELIETQQLARCQGLTRNPGVGGGSPQGMKNSNAFP